MLANVFFVILHHILIMPIYYQSSKQTRKAVDRPHINSYRALVKIMWKTPFWPELETNSRIFDLTSPTQVELDTGMRISWPVLEIRTIISLSTSLFPES